MKRYFSIMFLIIAWPAFTQTPPQLNEYLNVASDNNPALQASFAQYRAMLERANIAGAWPDPELSFGYLVYPWNPMPGMVTMEASYMQMLPLFGMLRTRNAELAARAESSFLLLQQQRLNLYRDVKISYYELYLIGKELEIMQQNIQLMQSMERVVQSGIEAGRGSMVDWLRMQMQIREMQVEIEDMQQMLEVQTAEFNALLNRPLEEVVILPDTLTAINLDIRLQEFTDTLLARSPQLLAMDAERGAAESMQRMARIEGRPDFGVGLQYMRMLPLEHGAPQMGMVMPMVSARIPLNRGRVNALSREAGFELEMVENERRDMENMLQAELRMLVSDYQSSQRKINLLAMNVENAQQAFRILLDSYMVERGMFDDLLTIQQQLLDYQRQLQQAIVQQNTAVARLEALLALE